MMARQVKIDQSSLGALQEFTLYFEKIVDQLDDDELDAAEAELQKKICNLLQKNHPANLQKEIPSFLMPETKNLRRPLSWKVGGFLMAAAALIVVQLTHSERAPTDSARLTKGLVSDLRLPCESRLIQSDRRAPGAESSSSDLNLYSIDSRLPTFLSLSCHQPVFVHLAERKAGSQEWIWLLRNQRLQQGFLWDAQKAGPFDLTPHRDSELRILASEQTLSETNQDPDAILARGEAQAWSESLKLLDPAK